MKSYKTIMQILIGFILLNAIQACSYYQGPKSNHFDGSRFFTNESHHTFSDMVKWMWEMESVAWPEWVDDRPQPPPPENVKRGELRITYINHATVLIQMDGINVLTDPIWSNRAGPVSWLGVKRVRNPGIKMAHLPKIDIVLVSHDHYDHLDFPSLEKLIGIHNPTIIAGLGVKERLASLAGNKVVELDWWHEHIHSTGIKITFVPTRHQSGRGLFDENKTLWGGFVIRGSAGDVLFLGDTGFGGFVDQIKKRFSRFRLAILPIGSYEKRWFMQNQHINPDDAVRIHQTLKVSQSVGMHFGTFAEHPEQTIDAHETDLKIALRKHGVSNSKFWILKFGEGRKVAEIEQ